MVVIRLARHGRNKYPVYRIVAADKKRAATSKFLAILGTYNPHTKEITLKKEEIEKYLQNGAQASDRVLRLLKAEGVTLPKWASIHDRNKAPKNQEEASEEQAPKSEEPEKTEGVETAEASAEQAEETKEAKKEDVGTVKENEDKKEAAKTSETVADAAEETTAEEQKS